MKAMKGQMKTMMEAMMDMRKTMEVNDVAVAATSTTTERDPTHPSVFNQESHLVSDVEGQGGATNIYGVHEAFLFSTTYLQGCMMPYTSKHNYRYHK